MIKLKEDKDERENKIKFELKKIQNEKEDF